MKQIKDFSNREIALAVEHALRKRNPSLMDYESLLFMSDMKDYLRNYNGERSHWKIEN